MPPPPRLAARLNDRRGVPHASFWLVAVPSFEPVVVPSTMLYPSGRATVPLNVSEGVGNLVDERRGRVAVGDVELAGRRLSPALDRASRPPFVVRRCAGPAPDQGRIRAEDDVAPPHTADCLQQTPRRSEPRRPGSQSPSRWPQSLLAPLSLCECCSRPRSRPRRPHTHVDREDHVACVPSPARRPMTTLSLPRQAVLEPRADEHVVVAGSVVHPHTPRSQRCRNPSRPAGRSCPRRRSIVVFQDKAVRPDAQVVLPQVTC